MLVSVALCTYNGERYLPEQLASLAAQSRPPDELVICDDRSTDTTVDLIRDFARTAPFPVRWTVNEKNLGSTPNFEQAISRCSGEIIFLCDQDDVWARERIAKFEAVFQAEPEVGLVASDLDVIGPDSTPLGYRMWSTLPFPPALQERMATSDAWRQLLRYNVVTGAAAAFRSSLRDALLPVPKCWVHDGWIALLTATLSQLRFIPEPLTLYRQHVTQQIGVTPLTLSRQITFARLRDAEYFAKLAECFEAAAERLTAIADAATIARVVPACRARARHAQAQARMRQGPRLARVFPAVRELALGNYHRFGHGWKGFAADLLL